MPGSNKCHGTVIQKAINANPGLKVNQSFNLFCINVFFTGVLYSLNLVKVKTEGQKI